MKIGDKTRAKVIQQIEELLETYRDKIETAYCNTEDIFAVTFKTKFIPAGDGTKVITQISFVESKVTDAQAAVVVEKQLDLFENDNVESVSFTHKDKTVTIGRG